MVVEAVASLSGCSVAALIGQDRAPDLVAARQMAMALIKDLTPLSLAAIGRHVGGRSPQAVAQAVAATARAGKADRFAAARMRAARAHAIARPDQAEDPLRLALDIVGGGITRTRPEQLAALAALTVGYAARLGDILTEPATPDPEVAPLIVPVEVARLPPALARAAADFLACRQALDNARYSPGERAAREHETAALRRLARVLADAIKTHTQPETRP
ncbi:MAG: hypothetical protein JNK56_39470 [Myxococcales bacterium]|nr:hypothetical protein [Myxococcales bacterium]